MREPTRRTAIRELEKLGTPKTVEALTAFFKTRAVGYKMRSNATTQLEADVFRTLKRVNAPLDKYQSIFDAIAHDDIAATKELLVKYDCADLEASDGTGFTPLKRATELAHEDIVELLLDYGADVNLMRGKGGPLHVAAENGHVKIAERLIARGAAVDLMPDCLDPTTPLHRAAMCSKYAVVRLLIAKGADVTIRIPSGSDGGMTPLHLAARAGCLDVAECLLAAGATIDARVAVPGDTYLYNTETALHLAAGNGHVHMVELLIANGADIKATAGHIPRAPLDYAAWRGQPTNVIQVLKEKGLALANDVEVVPGE